MNQVAVTPPKRSVSHRLHERKPGRLLAQSVTPGTLRLYIAATTRFVEWALSNGENPQDETELDTCLHEYIQWLYDDGGSKSLAKNAIAGLGLVIPRLRGCLPTSRLALRGWTNVEPVRSHPPLTWELTCLLAVHIFEKSPGLARLGIGIILAFDCLLRVSELVNLRREDIGFVGDERLGEPESKGPSVKAKKADAIVVIRHAKTGKNQWVELFDPLIIELLRGLVNATKPGDLLFPYSASVVRRELKGACASLGLSPLYVPHSLRHGGATRYRHHKGWSVESVAHRGRWASCKSARIYIQAGVAMLLAMKVSRSLHLVGSRLANSIHLFLDLARPRPKAKGSG